MATLPNLSIAGSYKQCYKISLLGLPSYLSSRLYTLALALNNISSSFENTSSLSQDCSLEQPQFQVSSIYDFLCLNQRCVRIAWSQKKNSQAVSCLWSRRPLNTYMRNKALIKNFCDHNISNQLQFKYRQTVTLASFENVMIRKSQKEVCCFQIS